MITAALMIVNHFVDPCPNTDPALEGVGAANPGAWTTA